MTLLDYNSEFYLEHVIYVKKKISKLDMLLTVVWWSILFIIDGAKHLYFVSIKFLRNV